MLKLWALVLLCFSFGSEAMARDSLGVVRVFKGLPHFLEGEKNWKAIRFIPLHSRRFPTFHPQGIKLVGKNLYLSTVEGRDHGFGHLIKYEIDSTESPTQVRATGRLTFPAGRSGRLNHAGGIDGDAHKLFLPLAEYNETGPTEIMEVNLKTFGVYKSVGRLKDHIGTVVHNLTAKTLQLMDWSTGHYSIPLAWLKGSNAIAAEKHNLADDWEYQDCKFVADSYTICSAKRGMLFPEGEIHLLKADERGSFPRIVHRVSVPHIHGNGKAGGRRPLTYNAMDFNPIWGKQGEMIGIRFFFVPHDDEDSHLMIFEALKNGGTILAGD
jgi:hypothetical protein